LIEKMRRDGGRKRAEVRRLLHSLDPTENATIPANNDCRCHVFASRVAQKERPRDRNGRGVSINRV
jgi:hypothetical protein